MSLMRARHEVFGVADVPATDFYRQNGWTEVDASTPTAVDERLAAENEKRRGKTPVVEYTEPAAFDPSEHTAAEVTAYLAGADDAEKQRVLDAEQAGQARKSVLGA